MSITRVRVTPQPVAILPPSGGGQGSGVHVDRQPGHPAADDRDQIHLPAVDVGPSSYDSPMAGFPIVDVHVHVLPDSDSEAEPQRDPYEIWEYGGKDDVEICELA